MLTLLSGTVWKFGDHIDTDLIISGKYLNLPMEELKKHVLEAVCPEFPREVKPGDILVGGRNFGCGSSRETAPAALKALGISAVVAQSFARIFYRNAIAIGLPAIVCPGVNAAFSNGDEARVDFRAKCVIRLKDGASFPFSPYPDEVLEVLEKGGIESLLKEIAERQGDYDLPRS